MRTPHFMTLGIVLLGVTLAPAAETVNGWYTDFNRAQDQARKLNRPMVVHFHTSWCGPCKRMERDVLNSPEVRRLLETQVVGVKVDGDHNPALRARYNVNSYPTDLILAPDGKLLTAMSGASPKPTYVATVAQYRAPALPPAVAAKPAAPAAPVPSAEEIVDAGMIEVGLEGYCPVSLFKTRSWKEGKKEYTYDYEGQRYFLAGPEELKAFKADPFKFAPRILGCDPVVYTTKHEAINGTTKFAAYFDGGLYLFHDDTSRKQFRATPGKFTTIQTVKAEDRKARG